MAVPEEAMPVPRFEDGVSAPTAGQAVSSVTEFASQPVGNTDVVLPAGQFIQNSAAVAATAPQTQPVGVQYDGAYQYPYTDTPGVQSHEINMMQEAKGTIRDSNTPDVSHLLELLQQDEGSALQRRTAMPPVSADGTVRPITENLANQAPHILRSTQ